MDILNVLKIIPLYLKIALLVATSVFALTIVTSILVIAICKKDKKF